MTHTTRTTTTHSKSFGSSLVYPVGQLQNPDCHTTQDIHQEKHPVHRELLVRPFGYLGTSRAPSLENPAKSSAGRSETAIP